MRILFTFQCPPVKKDKLSLDVLIVKHLGFKRGRGVTLERETVT